MGRCLLRQHEDWKDNFTIDGLIMLIDCGIAPKEVPLTPGPEAVSIAAYDSSRSREQCNPVYHIITGNVMKWP